MNAIEAMKQWLQRTLYADWPEIDYYMGHWYTNESYNANRYISYQTIGGRSPRGYNTRTASMLVTIVGVEYVSGSAKDAETNALLAISDKLMAATEQSPTECGIVSVVALGDVNGPMETEGGRPVVTLTLEVIF